VSFSRCTRHVHQSDDGIANGIADKATGSNAIPFQESNHLASKDRSERIVAHWEITPQLIATLLIMSVLFPNGG
jgi:hypothetical protein